MLARLAVRTGRLPSEWEHELEHNERAVWTVVALYEQQEAQQDREG